MVLAHHYRLADCCRGEGWVNVDDDGRGWFGVDW